MLATLPHTAEQLEQRLHETLDPTSLEVIDESYQHGGHGGAHLPASGAA